MKERDLLNWIVACAERFGWLVKHVPAPMVANRKGGFVGSPRAAGLPDLLLLHNDPPRMIVAEIKGTSGKLSTKQVEFLRAAARVAEQTRFRTSRSRTTERIVGVYVFTPDQQDIIEQMLRSRTLT